MVTGGGGSVFGNENNNNNREKVGVVGQRFNCFQAFLGFAIMDTATQDATHYLILQLILYITLIL